MESAVCKSDLSVCIAAVCRDAVVCTGSGIREALAWELRKLCPDCRVDGVDLGADFVTHGSTKELYRHYGLDGESIANYTQGVLS